MKESAGGGLLWTGRRMVFVDGAGGLKERPEGSARH